MASRGVAGRLTTAVVCALLLIASLIAPASAETGYATWYGPGFHGNVMANGQIFDENDPTTTASTQYPFGTWLKVINPANGRFVIVQVRDRGGFSHALDLSRAAFFALDPPNSWGFAVEYHVVSGPDGTAVVAAPRPRPAAPPAPPRPLPTATPVPRPTPEPVEHAVVAGETLHAVARRYAVSLADLIALNELADPDLIAVGQTLRLRSQRLTYVVKPGDTMRRIAEAHGVTVVDLAALNGIEDPDLIVMGVELVIRA